MYLVFDTETSTLPSDNLPSNHPEQAHLMQFGALVLDKEFNVVNYVLLHCKLPEYANVHPKAFEKHKITKEYSRLYGVESEVILHTLTGLIHQCRYMVGFNLEFDKKIINLVNKRVFDAEFDFLDIKEKCIMQETAPILALPFKDGKSHYGKVFKYPKLEEAFNQIVGFKIAESIHNALTDATMTSAILKSLVTKFQLQLP